MREGHELDMHNLKRESCGKLQSAGKTIGIDFLIAAEIAGAGVGHQIAGLVESLTVTASGPDRVILQLVDPVAVLHIKVGVVKQIEHFDLKLQLLALLNGETAGQAHVDDFEPRAIERVQSNSGARASSIDAGSGVRCVLIERGVVQVVVRAVAIAERESGTCAGRSQ